MFENDATPSTPAAQVLVLERSQVAPTLTAVEMHAGIVEFARLADDDRACPDDQD
jgi:hypothetical protein